MFLNSTATVTRKSYDAYRVSSDVSVGSYKVKLSPLSWDDVGVGWGTDYEGFGMYCRTLTLEVWDKVTISSIAYTITKKMIYRGMMSSYWLYIVKKSLWT